MYMHCVIGSGLAGVACAKALLARGAEVMMLDAGIELEPKRAELVRKLGSSKISQWTPEDIATLKGGTHTLVDLSPLSQAAE